MNLWNTITGRREEFKPQGDPIKFYVCGVTPYDEAHIGHAMSYIIFDVARRYLEHRGYKVNHVQNFTDVDDKILARAEQHQVPPLELSAGYIEAFLADMDSLNIQRAHVYPRVSQEIPAIVELIQRLVDRGYAYESHNDVYFRVQRFEGYGRLSHRTLEGMMAGARIEVDATKEHPMDFALWKAAKPGELYWESAWGEGRPGWHIECSAMSMKYLGATLDIHGGGQDLVFPHHENEIAQSECATGEAPFVRHWLHNGLLRLGEEKMSKSLGNLVTIKEVLASHTADALRMFVLTSQYRSPLTYSEEALEAAEKGVDRLREALRPATADAGAALLEAGPYRQRFNDAMDDDLNSAQAIAALFDLAREINRARAGSHVAAAQLQLREMAAVLGFTLEAADNGAVGNAGPFIDLLIEVRNELRKKKEFGLSDRIRDQLAERGVTLEDSATGTTWRAEG